MLQEPERTCICCRSKKSKHNLLRLVIDKDRLVFDKEQKNNGRGYYICKQSSCIKSCFEEKGKNTIRLKKFIKSLKIKIEITTGQLRELEELLIEEVAD
ncbi:MAG: YlxR family protein [Nitrospirae bacterium]|nr:YlxR family protein [Nitrospirota bacterium]MBF0542038.1 YlxR family protein [Nitrospirota bacterium]